MYERSLNGWLEIKGNLEITKKIMGIKDGYKRGQVRWESGEMHRGHE